MAKKAKDEGVVILNEQAKLVAIDSIQPHPENPRQGDVGAIYESMKTNGFYGFIVAQLSTGNILVGSHRWKAAKELDMGKVPVVYVDVDDDRARRIMLADNRTNDLASYDENALAALVRSLAESGGLEGTGFDGEDLDRMLNGLAGPQLGEPIDESIANGVVVCTCPECGHEHHRFTAEKDGADGEK